MMPGPDRLVLALVTAFIPLGRVAGSPLEVFQFPPDTAVQRILDERVEAGPTVTLVVGLLESDEPIRVLVAGAGDGGAHPLDGTSVFPIGSLSHVLTGTLLAEMARRGEVSPSDPVELYLPARTAMRSRSGRAVSLADLATHRSGLPSVPGVGLLGRILASCIDMTWAEAVQTLVLAPLGMARTGLGPDGEVFSTADDLLLFLSANLAEPRNGLQHAMRTAHHPRARLDLERTIGLTWKIHAAGGRRTIWHEGVAAGHRSFIGFDPDRGVGVVVLAKSGTSVEDLGFHLLRPPIVLDLP